MFFFFFFGYQKIVKNQEVKMLTQFSVLTDAAGLYTTFFKLFHAERMY